MRKLQVLLLVVVFVFVQFINISAGQNEKVTVHLPVAPSKIIPLTFGVDVMPFDESMGESYMDSSYHRFRYVVDKNLNIHGPLDIYSKEYEDLTGFKNEKLYPIGYDKNQILDEKMKTENIGFLDNSWEWNTRYIENIYEVNGVYYLELFDFIDMQIAWSSPTVDDEGFMYNDLLFGKFLVFIREIDGSSDKFREKYEYKYIDLKSGKEVLRRKSQRYSKDTLLMTAEKIANLKEGVFIDLPEEIKKIINDEDIRFSVLNRQDLYLVYLTFVGEDEFD